MRRLPEARNVRTRASIHSPVVAARACATFVACYNCSADASGISMNRPTDAASCGSYITQPNDVQALRQLASPSGIGNGWAMAGPIDPVALAQALIRCNSVTPACGEVFDVLEAALEALDFTVHRWVMGEPPDGPTENMVAIRGEGSPHFGFAGHLDVVPAGEGWSGDPFAAEVHDGILVGRGANDMKSAVAAFVSAISRVEQGAGTLSLLITGDEEGYSVYGTPRIIDWLNEREIRPDMILIGEPTSVSRLGDTVKIGRRGSVNMWIEVPGVQGHVAYPERGKNPVPPLARVIAALDSIHLDDGTDQFPPSNLEFTSVTTPTNASNVIPGSATALL